MTTALHVEAFKTCGRTRWDAVLPGLHSQALDCLQSTLAAIADEAYGTGTHLTLGSRWRFPALMADGAIEVQPTLAERMGQASELLGMAVSEPEGPMDVAELRRLTDDGPLYVVAEAYDLAWLPYSRAEVRYREMPHSFLLESGPDGYTVVDGYYADTEFGRARPGTWTMPAADLDRAISGLGMAVRVAPTGAAPLIDRETSLVTNAAIARAAVRTIEAYVEITRAGTDLPKAIERIVLDIWHLCRERLLQTLFLGDHPAAAEVRGATQRWQQLAAQSYLAMQRARHSKAPSTALVNGMAELLRADVELAIRLGDGAAPPADTGAGRATGPVHATTVADAVHDALRVVLRVDDDTIRGAAGLRSLPRFDSFRLVEIIDRVESMLGVELPADAVAADLADIEGLCRLFGRAAPACQG